jgi:hypothetical protein
MGIAGKPEIRQPKAVKRRPQHEGQRVRDLSLVDIRNALRHVGEPGEDQPALAMPPPKDGGMNVREAVAPRLAVLMQSAFPRALAAEQAREAGHHRLAVALRGTEAMQRRHGARPEEPIVGRGPRDDGDAAALYESRAPRRQTATEQDDGTGWSVNHIPRQCFLREAVR